MGNFCLFPPFFSLEAAEFGFVLCVSENYIPFSIFSSLNKVCLWVLIRVFIIICEIKVFIVIFEDDSCAYFDFNVFCFYLKRH